MEPITEESRLSSPLRYHSHRILEKARDEAKAAGKGNKFALLNDLDGDLCFSISPKDAKLHYYNSSTELAAKIGYILEAELPELSFLSKDTKQELSDLRKKLADPVFQTELVDESSLSSNKGLNPPKIEFGPISIPNYSSIKAVATIANNELELAALGLPSYTIKNIGIGTGESFKRAYVETKEDFNKSYKPLHEVIYRLATSISPKEKADGKVGTPLTVDEVIKLRETYQAFAPKITPHLEGLSKTTFSELDRLFKSKSPLKIVNEKQALDPITGVMIPDNLEIKINNALDRLSSKVSGAFNSLKRNFQNFAQKNLENENRALTPQVAID